MSEGQLKNTLFIIPARGGSKRLVGKNVKILDGIPLIAHSIEFAKQFTSNENICVSSDDDAIIARSKETGIEVPFVRPNHLATDEASSEDVIFHALNYYKELGKDYEYIVLLQPTSPFRKKEHLKNAIELLDDTVDAIISVAEKKKNSYSVLKREYQDGTLGDLIADEVRSFDKAIQLYEINGSIYLLRVKSLLKKGSIPKLSNVRKMIMSHYYSVDIDTIEDWKYCEFIIENQLLD